MAHGGLTHDLLPVVVHILDGQVLAFLPPPGLVRTCVGELTPRDKVPMDAACSDNKEAAP